MAILMTTILLSGSLTRVAGGGVFVLRHDDGADTHKVFPDCAILVDDAHVANFPEEVIEPLVAP